MGERAAADASESRRTGSDRHLLEIRRNLELWRKKPILRRIYRSFHRLIARHLAARLPGPTVELGSGIGNVKEVIAGCLRTDLFPNPWIDRVENAYALSFPDHLANLILFDVFHHLRYPGTALEEFRRVLRPGGRVVLFEPCVSALGRVVYGLFHHEPLGLDLRIEWLAPAGWSPDQIGYYAAQGNASRIFLRGELRAGLSGWRVVAVRRLSAISYVATGGYSKPQLYPDAALPVMRVVDRVCDLMPAIFATRLLVALEKPERERPAADGREP